MWSRIGSFAYWSLAAVFTVFGFVDLIAIGAPFLLTGVAMLFVGPWRRDRAILWPVLVGVWSFVMGYVLVAPIECRTTAGMDAVTECRYLFGLVHFFGGRPGLAPAFLAGLAAGAGGALMTSRRLQRLARRTANARS